MNIWFKRLALHCILAASAFIGLGIVSIPGPHGGLAMLLPYLFGLLNLFDSDLQSFLLVYPPMLLLVTAGLIKKDIYRIALSHIAVFLLVVFFTRFILNVYPPVRYIAFLTGGLFFTVLIVSYILPFFCFRNIPTVSHKFLFIESIIFVLLGAISVGAIYANSPRYEPQPVQKPSCQGNLEYLGMMLDIYKITYNKYPPPEKWCDTLIKGSYVGYKILICPFAGEGGCHYALNSFAEPGSPADMVLVYETNSGWNQYGGLEIANMTHHAEPGCYVLFNDKHVEFISPDKLNTLKWK
jgi:hypothetical protein